MTLGLGNSFLAVTPKEQGIKKKNSRKLSKIKICVLQMIPSRKKKSQVRRKYFLRKSHIW